MSLLLPEHVAVAGALCLARSLTCAVVGVQPIIVKHVVIQALRLAEESRVGANSSFKVDSEHQSNADFPQTNNEGYRVCPRTPRTRLRDPRQERPRHDDVRRKRHCWRNVNFLCCLICCIAPALPFFQPLRRPVHGLRGR